MNENTLFFSTQQEVIIAFHFIYCHENCMGREELGNNKDCKKWKHVTMTMIRLANHIREENGRTLFHHTVCVVPLETQKRREWNLSFPHKEWRKTRALPTVPKKERLPNYPNKNKNTCTPTNPFSNNGCTVPITTELSSFHI